MLDHCFQPRAVRIHVRWEVNFMVIRQLVDLGPVLLRHDPQDALKFVHLVDVGFSLEQWALM